MPIIGLKPQGNGLWTPSLAPVGAAYHYLAVDDSTGTTHDGDASYITVQRFGIDIGASFRFFLQSEGWTVNSVTVNVVAKRGAAAHPELLIGFLRAGSFAAHATLFDPGADWTLASRTFTTDPLTSVAWNPDLLPNTEVAVQSEAGEIGNNRVTLISVSVDYTEPHNVDPVDDFDVWME